MFGECRARVNKLIHRRERVSSSIDKERQLTEVHALENKLIVFDALRHSFSLLYRSIISSSPSEFFPFLFFCLLNYFSEGENASFLLTFI